MFLLVPVVVQRIPRVKLPWHANIASAKNRNLESTQLSTTRQLSLGVLSFGVAEKNPLNLIEVILAQGSWSGSSPQRMTFR
jgi:hypothetical protein